MWFVCVAQKNLCNGGFLECRNTWVCRLCHKRRFFDIWDKIQAKRSSKVHWSHRLPILIQYFHRIYPSSQIFPPYILYCTPETFSSTFLFSIFIYVCLYFFSQLLALFVSVTVFCDQQQSSGVELKKKLHSIELVHRERIKSTSLLFASHSRMILFQWNRDFPMSLIHFCIYHLRYLYIFMWTIFMFYFQFLKVTCKNWPLFRKVHVSTHTHTHTHSNVSCFLFVCVWEENFSWKLSLLCFYLWLLMF